MAGRGGPVPSRPVRAPPDAGLILGRRSVRMRAERRTRMHTGLLRAGEGKADWVVGDLYTILASGDDTGGAYALIHAVVPVGGGPPPHLHRREDEAFYVLEGEVTFQADGRVIRAGVGDWITLPKGSLHAF